MRCKPSIAARLWEIPHASAPTLRVAAPSGLVASVSNNSPIARAGAGLAVSLAAAGPAQAAGENYDVALGFFLALCFFLAFLIYIIPALVAWHRRHPRSREIWALTLLLGWTGIAWLAALVWALRTEPPDKTADPA